MDTVGAEPPCSSRRRAAMEKVDAQPPSQSIESGPSKIALKIIVIIIIWDSTISCFPGLYKTPRLPCSMSPCQLIRDFPVKKNAICSTQPLWHMPCKFIIMIWLSCPYRNYFKLKFDFKVSQICLRRPTL